MLQNPKISYLQDLQSRRTIVNQKICRLYYKKGNEKKKKRKNENENENENENQN